MTKRKLGSAALSVFLTAYAVLLIVNSQRLTEDMRSAVFRCLNIIIPSLYAFMAISYLIIRSGLYIYISKIFIPISKLIGLPNDLGFVFVISNCAGYPVGASMISDLYDKKCLDKKSASRFLCCCYNGGPAFFCGAVGLSVFSSSETGLIIFFSVVLANMITAAVQNRLFKIKCKPHSKTTGFGSDMICDSAALAGEKLLNVCAVILLFQTVVTLIESLRIDFFGADDNVKTLIYSFLEISNLTKLCGLPFYLLPFITAACSFGGICVILQIKAIVKDRFSIIPFIIARAVCAVLSGSIFSALNSLFGIKYVSVSAQTEFIVNFNNFIPSVCLIMMIFIILLKKRLAFSE
ncbi:MAG: hypothetical protein ACI4JW_02575 [Oscillospiraceae bacterium]